MAYVAVLAAMLTAGAVVDSADADGARQIWLYATVLTVGYMISRRLAMSGSREPYDDDTSRQTRPRRALGTTSEPPSMRSDARAARRRLPPRPRS
jgi:hypothetical protein